MTQLIQGRFPCPESPATGTMLAHMVYFTLKDNSSAAISKLLASCRKHLSGASGYGVVCGRNAYGRSAIVNVTAILTSRCSWYSRTEPRTIGIKLAERHLQFVAENKENWAKVRVLDADVS